MRDALNPFHVWEPSEKSLSPGTMTRLLIKMMCPMLFIRNSIITETDGVGGGGCSMTPDKGVTT